ncbi:MAG: CocE/NonD family hydrolase [Candidatus Dormibacteraeota bacterium]|nr:CocE/NonD family hydrolase [Candidatus Dormibacteraeota bacterium]
MLLTPSAEESPPDPYDAREHYTKYEYRIPMRDGVKLFTSVLVPKDASTTYPFMLLRTPFGISPYGSEEYGAAAVHTDAFLRTGYIWVRQDVRGRRLSEGGFVHVTPHRPEKLTSADVDESTDTYDTVEWLLQHVPNHNGRVGIWGISYPGFFTAAGIIDTHPAIRAASPQAPVADLFLGDDWYRGGALMLAALFDGAVSFPPGAGPPPKVHLPFDYGTSDGYEFFLKLGTVANVTRQIAGHNPMWDETIAHPTYDEYWQSRAIWRHLKNIHCAVLTVGGWFDAEDLMGPLRVYHAIEKNNPGITTSVVMGPWVHGGWARYEGRRLGSVDFAAATAKYYRENILLPFFEFHLKDKGDPKLPKAYVFETGSNVWRRYPEWPAPGANPQTLYFHEGGRLAFEPPAAAEASDSYVSDPAKPVPFIGYAATAVPEEYMVSDQRFAATRPDVLVYVTEPLDEDLTLAGPVSPKLFVSTTGTDSDWVVKLIDVYPPDRSDPAGGAEDTTDVGPPAGTLAGYQQLVRGWPFRGKFRNSFEHPEPFVPGNVEAVHFTMPDVNHVFRRGHRVMVQVQSSWFPLIDRNPQTFVNIPTAKPEDFKPATQHIVRSRSQPSGVEVSVLPAPLSGSGAL